MEFSDKRHDEIEPVGFDFSPRLTKGGGSIQTATFTVSVLAGADPDPADMLAGIPTVDGNVVKVLLGGGVPGVLYRITADVTTNTGWRLIESASLLVG